jgi:DNA repair exonuclease SbcCD ATPase subunit
MIKFQKVRWKNLLSYGNFWTEMDLSDNRMTIICGANGSGKSTFIDALTFALFGVPFRDINKPNLLNSINQKDCLVEVEFEIGSKKYMVRRGIKPSVFEIIVDGKLIDQDSKSKDYQKYLEQNILKINYKTFTQIVVLGSSTYVPFMKLTAAERREVIEELLDIRVFSRMNIILKEKMAAHKETMKECDNEIVLAKERLGLQTSHIDKLRVKNEEQVATTQAEIQKSNTEIEKLRGEVVECTTSVDSLLASVADKASVGEKRLQYADAIRKLDSQTTKHRKDIAFYQDTACCPTCTQPIEVSFREGVIATKQKQIETLAKAVEEATTRLEALVTRAGEIDDIQKRIQSTQTQIALKTSNISGIQQYIEKLQTDISKVQCNDEEYTAEVAKVEGLTAVLTGKTAVRASLVQEKYYLEVANALLKDTGIKTKIIRQYLPLMNKYINKYLGAMDFFANFNLDENFDEVIKSRHRDEFEYNSFSEGEKFRIDMALMMTWREIAAKKNSTNTNILVLDEVFDRSLDSAGTEEFMKLLQTISGKINIFVISHKPDVISDKFDQIIRVEKKSNFSSMRAQ